MFIWLLLCTLELIMGYLLPFYESLNLISNKNINTLSQDEVKRLGTYWITLALLQKTLFPLLCFLGDSIESLSLVFGFLRLAIVLFLTVPQLQGCEMLFEKAQNSKELQGFTEVVKNTLKQVLAKINLLPQKSA